MSWQMGSNAGRITYACVAGAVLCALLADVVNALHTGAFTSGAYRRLDRVAADEIVPLVIALKPHDRRALEERLWRVSDPRENEYGRHLTKHEANELSKPDERALTALYEWIHPFLDASSQQKRVSEVSNSLKVSMPARQLEALLNTELHVFEATGDTARSGHRRLVRAAKTISVPAHLDSAIAYISVNSHPFNLRSLAASAPTGSGGGTLEEIRSLYNIPEDLVVTNPLNSQTVPSFYHESWNSEDLGLFYKQFLPNDPLPTIVAKGNRKNVESRASIEATLDVQYITGVARNTTTYVWTMDGSNPYSVKDEPFVEFAEAVLEMDRPPYVISISYSDDEEHIFQVSPDYAFSLDTLLIKMGLRGITVLIASGDDGVAGLRPEFMNIPNDQACDKNGPQWPTGSPYITAVGATMKLSPQRAGDSFFATKEEVVCSGAIGGVITTGGAFSNVYAMPEYQRSAVTKYLKSKQVPTLKGFFNASGRAYPDISALGASFAVYLHGSRTSVSGTSASTPVVGAMVTLWNDIRLNAGKTPLGFINPLLYYLAEHVPEAFNDVVVGNNGASKGTGRTCNASFGATAGWDAVSGVGTPNFAVISEFIRTLGDKFNLTAMANGDAPAPTTPQCNSTVNLNASAPKDGLNTLSTVVLVASMVVVAVLGVVFSIRMYKHRRRTAYASLNGQNLAGRDERSSSTPPGSPSSSPRGSIVNLDEESSGIEMSEISLHE